MKRTFISIFSLLSLLLLFSTVTYAQSIIPGTNEEKQVAIDRYNQVHDTSLKTGDLANYLAPTQANLKAWEAVLADFSQKERMDGSGVLGFAHDKTVTSNAHYRYISRYIVVIKKGM